jgi:hypothetical protein
MLHPCTIERSVKNGGGKLQICRKVGGVQTTNWPVMQGFPIIPDASSLFFTREKGKD